MANLLFWLGPDRIIGGTDFPIWCPHWLLDRFMTFELPGDIEEEYGVTLTMETNQKVVGENIARLYGIDIEAKKQQLAGDEFDVSHQEFANSVPARTRPGRARTETGVAGTAGR